MTEKQILRKEAEALAKELLEDYRCKSVRSALAKALLANPGKKRMTFTASISTKA